MTTILHPALPFAPWADPRTRRLPGILPLDMADWLRVDAVFGPQMALRDHLIATREADVHALLPQARAAAAEVYALILQHLPPLGYVATATGLRRPDGVEVPLDAGQPLLTLGRLVQNDICLMQEDGTGEHALTGAILCFPAGWTLSEKLGRPLMRMHAPVPAYSDDVGRRVQRLMDAVRPETPLWRANANLSRAPLFNPQPEDQDRHTPRTDHPFVRSERQCLIRLPQSRAVVFTIHTYVVRREDLTPDQTAALAAHPLNRPDPPGSG